jgi:hypothetical protein
MIWTEEKQRQLNDLRRRELAGALTDAEAKELAVLFEEIDAEERNQLAPALARMHAENAALHRQVHKSAAVNEQLAALVAQQEQLLADARKLLRDLSQRQQAIREKYYQVTGEPLLVAG